MSEGDRFVREERKVITAVFADVVGSTALGERLDPEDAKIVVGEAIARIVGAVEGFGGTIKDLAGDGVLALFGAPTSHEDDPERAVRAALQIVEEIGAYAQEVQRAWSVQGFGVRVGVQTGSVVLGAVGAGSRVEYGAVGDAVNTAARLQSKAPPGSPRPRAERQGRAGNRIRRRGRATRCPSHPRPRGCAGASGRQGARP